MATEHYDKGEHENSATSPGRAKRDVSPDKILLTLSDFEVGKFETKQEHNVAIAELIRDFSLGRKCASGSVSGIVGYSDAVDTEAFNVKLRAARAEYVSGMFEGLIKKAWNPGYVPKERVEAAPAGTFLNPSNSTAAGRADNRAVRVELARVSLDPYFVVKVPPDQFNKDNDTCGVVNAEVWESGPFTLNGLSIRGRKQWAARAHPLWEREVVYYNTNLTPLEHVYTRIVVHHTSNNDSLMKNEMKEQGRGFAAIGYHFAIDQSGNIIEGRPLAVMGSHAGEGLTSGPLNDPDWGSVGIVLLGDFESRFSNVWSPDEPSADMLKSLELLVRTLTKGFTIGTLALHKEIIRKGDPTVCPGEKAIPHVEALRKKLGLSKP